MIQIILIDPMIELTDTLSQTKNQKAHLRPIRFDFVIS